MSDYLWTPPGLSDEEARTFLETRQGLPDGVRPQLLRWITNNKEDTQYLQLEPFLNFQTSFRRSLGLPPRGSASAEWVRRWADSLEDDALCALIDYRLSQMYPRPSFQGQPANEAARLKEILRSAGSSWTVGDRSDRWGLIEALPEAVLDVARQIATQAGESSQLLNTAWSSAFGPDRRPSHAYYDAVRAVEVYSCPLISPKDKVATLGKNISVLRSKPEAWVFALSGDQSIGRVIATLELLWHSQTDRHGRASYEDVTVEEAQAAVLLATTIVGWLACGLVQRAGVQAI